MPEPAIGAEPKAASLARTARELGLAALRDGKPLSAITWLERTHRLVPADINATLSLATACLGYQDERAAALFREVLAAGSVREAWVGLASACVRLHDPSGAANALGNALRRNAPVPEVDGLADEVVQALELPGWCGLPGSGIPVVRAAPGVVFEVRVDGRKIGGRLPKAAWATACLMTVTAGGHHLLGSPIEVPQIGRVEGCVEPVDNGMRGWAWHPGDPETSPILTILDAAGRVVQTLVATDEDVAVASNGGLFRPRGFRVPAARLTGRTGPFQVMGRDGVNLLGSPLDPYLFGRLTAVPVRSPVPLRMPALADAQRPVAIVLPVRGHPTTVLACLDSVFAAESDTIGVIVVDDASQEPNLIDALDRLAEAGRIRVIRNQRSVGFAASANAGIRACPEHDVVLLNSDTLVPPGWLGRLRQAAYTSPDIGTVTPLSNNASIVTHRIPGDTASLSATIAMDRMAQRANRSEPVEIPVGAGFCLYVKRACLDAVGPLRAEIFAQGYGEESDFCLRARTLGWRHMALPSVFVTHLGGTSFGSAGHHLRVRNEPILERLHPGYSDLVRSFLVADPLASARHRLDLARWRASRSRKSSSVILITHGDGGGVEQRIAGAAAAYRADGLRPIVLRPAMEGDGQTSVLVGDGPEGGFSNLRYRLPDELPALLRLLRSEHPAWIEVHHLLNHSPALYGVIQRMGVPYDVHIHDYTWICPRISLIGQGNRYCGEPDLPGCESCISRLGRLVNEDLDVKALRRRSAAFLANARRVIAPSRDAATRMHRYFPLLPLAVMPHADDSTLPALNPLGLGARVCIAGGIGPHKGFDILLACARDAAERALNLEFVVVGDTTDDDALLATGRAFVTGTYRSCEAVDLIRAQNANLGFVPSVWPETWSLTLTELWRAGLPVAAFDLGAPAERIRATGRGFVLPLGLSPAAINKALLAAIAHPGHE